VTTDERDFLSEQFEHKRIQLRAVAYRMLGSLSEADDAVGPALLLVLDPDVVLRAECAAVEMGATKEVRGGAAVADTFKGQARVARLAIANGAVGAVCAPGGRPRVVIGFTITRGKIVEIELLADPEQLPSSTW